MTPLSYEVASSYSDLDSAVAYKFKCDDLKSEAARDVESLAQLGDVDLARAKDAIKLFDCAQNAAEIW